MRNESEPQTTNENPNRLAAEKSPYLLQHAFNSVDWYPWGPQAFQKAIRENKPVFLSIGYSTCHWCHVMERESFEDPDVAQLMNDAFVSIKVDREERPDLDSLYMTVCQVLTQRGGWPLTIIMTPDKKPFFARTYIPKASRFGITGMLELVPQVQRIWSARYDDVVKSADEITAAIRQASTVAPREDLNQSILQIAYDQLAKTFDSHHGGFGNAPKFPTPHQLLFLLRYWKRTDYRKVLNMVEETLLAMRRGGIYDHVGFGFHRYSTDSKWLVPHFEKMLYDQALLAITYTEAYQATGKDEYQQTAKEIFAYVLRHMTAFEGGFYSAEDADSEGEEGKFYLWTEKEIRCILGKEADCIMKVFNVEKTGNFKEETTGRETGRNILHLTKALDESVPSLVVTERGFQQRLEKARQQLFIRRESRVHPDKDDKVLTDWNGLMIAALAKASQVFGDTTYAEAAERASGFILSRMRRADGRLLHRYRDGQAAISAHADDYAFLIWGLIDLYEASFKTRYLQAALELNKDFLSHFCDHTNGGFYLAADDGENLLLRQKEAYDGATPSSNSVAMLNLLRLSRLTADPELEGEAASVGRAFSESASRSPSAHTLLMTALDFAIGPSHEVVIVGNSQAEDTKAMVRALRKPFIPNKVVLLRPTELEYPDIVRIAPFTVDHTCIDGKATAYICTNHVCKLPTTDIGQMLDALDAGKTSNT